MKLPVHERSCTFCALARGYSGLTICAHCGWIWDGKSPRPDLSERESQPPEAALEGDTP